MKIAPVEVSSPPIASTKTARLVPVNIAPLDVIARKLGATAALVTPSGMS